MSVGHAVQLGQEWLVDASGCDSQALKTLSSIQGLCEELVVALSLKVIGQPMHHIFDGHAGITSLWLLSESHIAVHSFPEHRFVALSLYSCRRTLVQPDFDALLHRFCKATTVAVRTQMRGVPA